MATPGRKPLPDDIKKQRLTIRLPPDVLAYLKRQAEAGEKRASLIERVIRQEMEKDS